jgi:hypothetical protein
VSLLLWVALVAVAIDGLVSWYDSTCRLCNLCMCSMADMWDVVTGWVSLCVVECLPSQAKERLL